MRAYLLRTHPASAPFGLALCALIVAAVSIVPAAPAQEGIGDSGVLLLRNGQTLEGRIQAGEEGYVVVVPGGQICVKRFEVLACCRDLAEVYRYKLNLIRLDSAQDRLALAQWCHQVGLLAEAERELAAATALDPTHPLIPVLRRQLRTSPLVPEGGPVGGQPAPGPSTYELDLMVRGMPPGTVETFVQTIQPLLVNRCGAAACHGQTSPSRFRLLRTPPEGLPSRRVTQRNLYAVLQWIDRAHPEQSPLVTVPLRPHGTARAPVFADHQLTQYRQLVAWCYRVAQADLAVTQASYEEPAAENRPAGPRTIKHRRQAERTGTTAASEVFPAVAAGQTLHEGGEAMRDLSGRGPGDASGKAKGGHRPASVPVFTPIDPFDPEMFNRQFWPDGKAPVQDRSDLRGHRPPTKPAEARPTSRARDAAERGEALQQPVAPADPPLPSGPLDP